MPKYSEIEWAFEFVSGGPYGAHRAVYDKATGQFLISSDLSGHHEIPDELDEERYVKVPHKFDLDLGTRLVFAFVHKTCPGDAETVHRIFRGRGAYRRFKDFLDERNLLYQWYDFEAAAQRQAIEEWCEEYGIEISKEEEAT